MQSAKFVDPTKDLMIDTRKQSIKSSINVDDSQGLRYIPHQQVSPKVHHIPIPNRQRAGIDTTGGKQSQLS